MYYENIYNLNNRFKQFNPDLFEAGVLSTTTERSSLKLETDNGMIFNFLYFQIQLYSNGFFEDKELLNEQYILNDNKNSENVEAFKIVEECEECDSYSLKFLHSCQATGFKEIVDCDKHGHASRRFKIKSFNSLTNNL